MKLKIGFLVVIALTAQLASTVTFEEMFNAADILGDTIRNESMSHYMVDYNETLAVTCIEGQKENFFDFGDTIGSKVIDVGSELGEDIGTEAKNNLATIGISIKGLPQSFWAPLTDNAPKKALEVRQETGVKVKKSAELLAKIIEDLAKTKLDVATKAQQKMSEIHEEAKKKSTNFNRGIRDCVWAATSETA